MALFTITTWFALGTVGMALGTLALAWAYTQLTDEHQPAFLELIAVTAIATVAYGLMALDVGAVTNARGATLYIPRYVDWLLTTPLHVLYLGWLAGGDRRTIGKMATLQAATIVFGFAGGMIAAPLNLLLFAVGSLLFAGVVWLLFSEVADAAHERSDQRLALYRTLRNFVIVLWLIYPVIWLLGQTGFGLMDTETTSLIVTYIDVVAKVGFGLIAFSGLQDISFLQRAEASDTDVAAAD